MGQVEKWNEYYATVNVTHVLNRRDCCTFQATVNKKKLKNFVYCSLLAVNDASMQLSSDIVVVLLLMLQFGIESRVAPYTAADRPVIRSRPQQVLVVTLLDEGPVMLFMLTPLINCYPCLSGLLYQRSYKSRGWKDG